MTARAPANGVKFQTPFGSMFLHVAKKHDAIVSVQISHQMKDPEARVTTLVEAINTALRQLCEGA